MFLSFVMFLSILLFVVSLQIFIVIRHRPIGDFSIGESKDLASASVGVVPATEDKKDDAASNQTPLRQVELVTCSGAAKSGSLRILQHGLRPYVQDQYPGLTGCLAMWALYGPDSGDGRHAYQVLSRTDGTQLLANLQEVEQAVDFVLNVPTIDAGNVYLRDRMVQVCASGVRLLDGTQSVQEVTPPADVVLSSILDPYVVIVLASGALLLLTAKSAAKDTLIETEPILPTVRVAFSRPLLMTIRLISFVPCLFFCELSLPLRCSHSCLSTW